MESFNNIDIIEWCEYDDNIKSKMNEIKSLKSKKEKLENNIFNHINQNNLQDSVFNISSTNTKIQYHKSSVKETITLKFLENTLLNYFENDLDKTNTLMDFIKNNRNISEKFSLKRKLKKIYFYLIYEFN